MIDEPKLNIHEACAAIMRDAPPIKKDRKGFKANYRGIDDVCNVFNPLLAKYGVTPSPLKSKMIMCEKTETKTGPAFFIVACVTHVFTAIDGSYKKTETLGSALSADAHGIVACQSVAYRIALTTVFCSPTEDLAELEQLQNELATKPVALPPKKKAPEAPEAKIDRQTILKSFAKFHISEGNLLEHLKEKGSPTKSLNSLCSADIITLRDYRDELKTMMDESMAMRNDSNRVGGVA